MDWTHINGISGQVVDSAITVHTSLGPGLLESAYRACLAWELRKRSLTVAEEVGLPVVYDGHRLEIGYRMDILVEGLFWRSNPCTLSRPSIKRSCSRISSSVVILSAFC